MPMYEYRCKACEEEFEEFLMGSETDADVECPACGEYQAMRQLSAFSMGGGYSSYSGGSSASCGTSGFS